jgi:nucleoid-associated protein YgaU
MIDSAPLIKSLGLEVRSVPFRVEPMRRAEIPVKPIILPADIGMVSSTVCTDQYRSIMGDGTETIVTEKKCVSMTYQYKLYRVKKGDSLVRIAKLVYGTENLWKLVYEANRELLGPKPHDPGALRAGMELHIIMSSRRDEWTE